MRDAISRVTAAFAVGAEGAYERALQSSMLVSADMAHAHHPNYPEKHDPDHKPQFHAGLVIKHNVNQRYATNAVSATLFRWLPPLLHHPRAFVTKRGGHRMGLAICVSVAPCLGGLLRRDSHGHEDRMKILL